MALRLALLFILTAMPAEAASRGTLIAMAVALLDVAEEHCAGHISIDENVRKDLFIRFHEYDIGGLASVLSAPLNSFYEEFLDEAQKRPTKFCRDAPVQAARTGFPVIVVGE